MRAANLQLPTCGSKTGSTPALRQHLAYGHRELVARKVGVDEAAVDGPVAAEYSYGLRLQRLGRFRANRRSCALEQLQNTRHVCLCLCVWWNAAVTCDRVHACVVGG